MAVLPIIVAPDPRLKVVSKPVDKVDAAVARLMDDMLETMYDAPGIGLAAPQVGVPTRVIVVDIARKDKGEAPNPLRMANPQLVATSEELRNLSFEVQLPSGAKEGVLKAYALYFVCEGEEGVCMFLRQDFEVPVRKRE